MKCLKPLFTKIRDKETEHLEFVKYANRLMSVICEEGFAYSRALSSNQGASVASSSTTVCAESDESTVIIQTSAGECMIKTPRGGTYPSPAAAVAASASAAVATVTTPTNSVFIGK
jgi:uracil phosphoribosyltransferase